jgi:hypothetical protein
MTISLKNKIKINLKQSVLVVFEIQTRILIFHIGRLSRHSHTRIFTGTTHLDNTQNSQTNQPKSVKITPTQTPAQPAHTPLLMLSGLPSQRGLSDRDVQFKVQPVVLVVCVGWDVILFQNRILVFRCCDETSTNNQSYRQRHVQQQPLQHIG